jgi:hypothetical protein
MTLTRKTSTSTAPAKKKERPASTIVKDAVIKPLVTKAQKLMALTRKPAMRMGIYGAYTDVGTSTRVVKPTTPRQAPLEEPVELGQEFKQIQAELDAYRTTVKARATC